MTLTPFLNAPILVQVHALSALLGFVLGTFVLFRPKGTASHKLWGRLWVGTMAIAVASSWFIFGIGGIGPFSFIHIFSLLGTIALVQIVYFARRGNIMAHKSAAKGLYFGGLIVAGTLAFMPGRVMNSVLFGHESEEGFYLIAAIALVGAGITYARQKRFSLPFGRG